MDKGFVLTYTGDGKGKTTAVLGLALRAAGHGYHIFIGQFMKGQYNGELTSLKKIEIIAIEQYGDVGCITRDQVTEHHVAQANQGLKQIKNIMAQNRYDLNILDEICVAIWFGLIKEDDILDLIHFNSR